MKVRAYDIVWDTGNDKVDDLPTDVIIDVPVDHARDIDEELAGALSDEYGWCVESVLWEPKWDKEDENA